MRLIVGLGNVGFHYEKTRHNTGFMTVNEFAEGHQMSFHASKLNARVASKRIRDEKVIVAKPTTDMNLSGKAVAPLLNFYKIPVENLIVCYDDMDLPVGRIRLRDHGSAGGHNGIKSIIREIGTNKFKRIRVGTSHPQRIPVDDYVLSGFTKEQLPHFEKARDKAVAALNDWTIGLNFNALMNKYN